MKRLTTKQIGDAGEECAVTFLEHNGYKILFKNFRIKRIEIDIIAEYDDIIIFVEVKTRSSNKFGTPAEAVEIHKQRKIILAAKMFLQKNKIFDRCCRFDVIEVFSNYNVNQDQWHINHIENAFEVS